MTEMTPDSAPKRRVKFGNAPTQTVPFEWAESMLVWLFEHHQGILGDALQHAAGIEPNRRRRPAGAQ